MRVQTLTASLHYAKDAALLDFYPGGITELIGTKACIPAYSTTGDEREYPRYNFWTFFLRGHFDSTEPSSWFKVGGQQEYPSKVRTSFQKWRLIYGEHRREIQYGRDVIGAVEMFCIFVIKLLYIELEAGCPRHIASHVEKRSWKRGYICTSREIFQTDAFIASSVQYLFKGHSPRVLL
jgi:hypothetical protein